MVPIEHSRCESKCGSTKVCQTSVLSTRNVPLLVLLLTVLASPAGGNSVGFQNEGGSNTRRPPVARWNGSASGCSWLRRGLTPCSISAGSLFQGTFNQRVTKKADRRWSSRHPGGAYYGFGVVGALGIDAALSNPRNKTTFAMSDEHASAVNLGPPGTIAIPEPGSLRLLATGLVGIVFVLRRRM
jgi:hypothetical protein